MSVNKYNNTTGELVTLASGSRIWIGTKEAHDAAVQAGTMPSNCLVALTNDDEAMNEDVTLTLESGITFQGSVVKTGDLITLSGQFNKSSGYFSTRTSTLLGTIPYKPDVSIYTSATFGGPSWVFSEGSLYITTDGKIYSQAFNTSTTLNYIVASISYKAS